MKYKYPPILKYVLLFVLILMFMNHCKSLKMNDNFLLVVPIIFYIIVFDYILVDQHPNLFGNEEEFKLIQNEDRDNYDDENAYD